MSLRARMGLAGGIAVALAVIAVAFSAYAGTRSTCAARSTNRCASSPRRSPSPGGPGNGGGDGGPGPAGELFGGPAGGLRPLGTHDCDEGTRAAQRPGWRVRRRRGRRDARAAQRLDVCAGRRDHRIPISTDFKATAASGTGQYFTSMDVGSTAIRVLTTGLGARGALPLPFR